MFSFYFNAEETRGIYDFNAFYIYCVGTAVARLCFKRGATALLFDQWSSARLAAQLVVF